jgi:lysophospholipase L1-like esterase
MKPTPLLVPLLACLLVGLWGCGEDDSGCGSDVDCPSSQICDAGTCADSAGGDDATNNASNNAANNDDRANNVAANNDGGGNNGDPANNANSGANSGDPVNNGANNDPFNNDGFNNDAMVDCQTLAAQSGAAVTGRVYRDNNGSDQSTYASGYEEGVDRPLGGVTMNLIAAGGVEMETSTCADGQYGFDQLDEGVYVVQAGGVQGRCAQRNCPKRFPEAIREGQVKIVTFGDSVPVEGNAPFFPSRLSQLLEPLVEVDNQNIAVSGSTSVGWLPGTSNFENRLLAQVDDADVIMISLGGNDILAFVQNNLGNLGDIEGLVSQAFVAVEIIIENLLEIVAAIRERNSTADIVYLLYPNYGLAVNNQVWSLVNTLVGPDTVRDILISAREGLPEDAGVLMVDLFGASEANNLPLDDYLFDPLHFNDLGQTLYAEEVFKAMGGVLIGPNPLTGQPRTPLGVEANFSVAP